MLLGFKKTGTLKKDKSANLPRGKTQTVVSVRCSGSHDWREGNNESYRLKPNVMILLSKNFKNGLGMALLLFSEKVSTPSILTCLFDAFYLSFISSYMSFTTFSP